MSTSVCNPVTKLTNDYGRMLDCAPTTAPTDGWLVEAEWCGRPGCPPEIWFCANEKAALELLDSLEDLNHRDDKDRYQPPFKRGNTWYYDLTCCSCLSSSGKAKPIAAGTSLVPSID